MEYKSIRVGAALLLLALISVMFAGCGKATGLVSIPIRNMHTPAETVRESDIAAARRLYRPGEQQRGTAGHIHLAVMMALNYLNIKSCCREKR